MDETITMYRENAGELNRFIIGTIEVVDEYRLHDGTGD